MTTATPTKKKVKTPRPVRTPVVLQMEAVECGAASLGIILSYYGRIVPLPELRRACGVSRDGSKASNVIKAAEFYGMKAQGFKKQLESLRELPPPYIIFWHFNHFLVVEGIKGDRVFLNDPAQGRRTVSWEEFDEGFTGVVLVMTPGENFVKGGVRPTIWRGLWRRLQPSLLPLFYCIVAGFLLVLPQLAIPVFSKVFVDNILIDGRTDWLRPLLLGMGLTLLLRLFIRGLQLLYLRRLKVKMAVEMSGKFLWHVLHLPVSFYAQRFAGEISARVPLNDNVAAALSGNLTTTVIDLVLAVIYAGVMFAYNVPLTIVGVTFALINIAALQLVARSRVEANMQLALAHGKVDGVGISGLMSIETIKASGLESDFFSRWAGYYAKAINIQNKLGILNQRLGVLPSLLQSTANTSVLLFGGLQVMDGKLSIGDLVAFQSLLSSFLDPVNNLVSFGNTLQDLEGDLSRLDDVLQNPTDARPVVTEVAGKVARLQGYVELRNVTFGYSRVSPPIIENFNLSLKPGQRVALVGASGSGKSTVAKLVAGLYEPWSGEVLFDGVPRSEIPHYVLTNSLSMVEQEVFLFSGTIKDNLTLWDKTIPTADIVQALEDAVIYETVRMVPGGLDGELLEGGVNLSGGQRQRLEIARALVTNPSILILDEATSALDTESEFQIVQNLRRRQCTCVVVAHRLSTIRDCDEIIVFDRGKIAQRGTHEELIAVPGVYRDLLASEEQGEDE
ncbi:MAG: NHLP family bacteriocin export ABC transporter peptidase/permease/ATPase subunit [Pseudanabaenaceae cyanobacterium SKYGB_i_bin29]|nr:NHLP family bacteriocin export ABC transporter peptidase/permease/ATPase subunit [Pseudanabaenaceae cyanobacterium SKYG29]MDW8421844.1 NHLP family bacteriocin export ABC transporter peptidase/permease/ATPase subunit [Pseudanabaenaceae cyanobacterium SKYGB_i_bin29]